MGFMGYGFKLAAEIIGALILVALLALALALYALWPSAEDLAHLKESLQAELRVSPSAWSELPEPCLRTLVDFSALPQSEVREQRLSWWRAIDQQCPLLPTDAKGAQNLARQACAKFLQPGPCTAALMQLHAILRRDFQMPSRWRQFVTETHRWLDEHGLAR
jgi:hypothetical protein